MFRMLKINVTAVERLLVYFERKHLLSIGFCNLLVLGGLQKLLFKVSQDSSRSLSVFSIQESKDTHTYR